MKHMKKSKNKRIWYRKPKERIVIEHLFSVDENTTVSIIEAVEGETPWRIPTSEKVKKLIRYADSLGLKHLNSHQEFETIPGVLTKEQQAIKDFENQFREAIFYGCGAQQYL